MRGRVAPRVTSTRRGRSASLPRDRPERDLSKWDPTRVGTEGTVGTCSSPDTASRILKGARGWEWGWGTVGTRQLQRDPAAVGPDPADAAASHPAPLSSAAASDSDPSPAAPRATRSPWKSPGSPPGAVTFRGQYTGGCQRVAAGGPGWPPPRWWPPQRSRWVLAGTRYQVGMPRAAPAPQEEPGTPGCPRCHGSRTPSGEWPWEQPPVPLPFPKSANEAADGF